MVDALGRLEPVSLRDIWETEAQDFTPWLAQEENLKILADTINMELELEAQERNVGPFRADILCRNSDDDSWVLIENQLERTNHAHIGQLLTYAAGLDVVTIVWVAANFTEEHRATLDWLNDITSDKFRFFGLEVELWKIGNSPPAPKFNIVSKPNDWTQSISEAARQISESELTETRATYFRYWSDFRDYLAQSQSPLRARAPRPRHHYPFGIGRSGYWLSALAKAQDKTIGVMLTIRRDPKCEQIRQLMNERDKIENEVGAKLDWREMPENLASRVALFKPETDPLDDKDWPTQFDWLRQTLHRFDDAFRHRIRNLESEEFDSEDEEVAE